MTELQNPDWLEARRGLLGDLLRSGEHSDLSLVTADQRTVRAHQVILSTASPSLRNILLEHSESEPDPVINLAGMKLTELFSLLNSDTSEVMRPYSNNMWLGVCCLNDALFYFFKIRPLT